MVSQVVQKTVELLHARKTPAPIKQHSKYVMFMNEAFQIILNYSIDGYSPLQLTQRQNACHFWI